MKKLGIVLAVVLLGISLFAGSHALAAGGGTVGTDPAGYGSGPNATGGVGGVGTWSDVYPKTGGNTGSTGTTGQPGTSGAATPGAGPYGTGGNTNGYAPGNMGGSNSQAR